MSSVPNRFEIFLWFASLLCALLLLQLLGESVYALPALNSDAFSMWINDTEPAVVVFTFIRIIAMVAIVYLLVATALCAVAHRTPSRRFIRIVDALTVPTARAFAVRLASVSAVSALALPATSAFATGNAATDAPTMLHLLPSEAAPSFADPTTRSTITPTTTTSTTSAPATTATAPRQLTVEPEQRSMPTTSQRYTVQRGENFWVIAQDTLTNELRREPTDAEITNYWRQLVELNSHRLKQHDDPDLIFAGQQIELPPVPH